MNGFKIGRRYAVPGESDERVVLISKLLLYRTVML